MTRENETPAGSELKEPVRLPPEVARMLLLARAALVNEDVSEAYHQIYMIADLTALDPFNPWDQLEQMAKA